VMIMRPGDLVEAEPIWEYRPGYHKGTWRHRDRVIPLGPRAQAIVRAFLKPDPKAFMFDPRDAVAAHHGARAEGQRSTPTPSELAKRAARPGEARCPRYDRRTYRQAIVRACDKSFPHPTLSSRGPKSLTAGQAEELAAWRRAHRWTPLQLRHTAATEIRARFGLEAAQVVLGHMRADTTEIYAERDLAKARGVMAEIG
jgi:integrase